MPPLCSLGSSAARAEVVGFGSMVTGYNHQIPYAGRVYHVQTEDSGRNKGHIHTHVFHAGTIVASTRVDYDDEARKGDVRDLLRKSHKEMLRKLVRGLLDEAIARRLGRGSSAGEARALPAPSPAPTGEAPLAAAAQDAAEDATPKHDDGADGGEHDAALALRSRQESLDMDNINQVLDTLKSNVTGTLGVALVDFESGMCLGSTGTGINIEVAAAGNTEVMKAKMRVMRDLGLKGGIDDILITLQSQYHIIRPVGTTMFMYLAIDRDQGNLALARHKLSAAAETLQI